MALLNFCLIFGMNEKRNENFFLKNYSWFQRELPLRKLVLHQPILMATEIGFQTTPFWNERRAKQFSFLCASNSKPLCLHSKLNIVNMNVFFNNGEQKQLCQPSSSDSFKIIKMQLLKKIPRLLKFYKNQFRISSDADKVIIQSRKCENFLQN